MKIGNTLKLNADSDFKRQIPILQNNMDKLFQLASGRVRFGSGTDGARGENIAGEFQQFTSHASANTEFSVTHTLNAVPIGAIVFWKDKAGELYQGPSTGTAWTTTTVYFKSTGTSVTFLVFLVK